MSQPDDRSPDRRRWCDLMCEHADFARREGLDGSTSCRTFQVLWCRKLEQHVTKNAPCEAPEA